MNIKSKGRFGGGGGVNEMRRMAAFMPCIKKHVISKDLTFLWAFKNITHKNSQYIPSDINAVYIHVYVHY